MGRRVFFSFHFKADAWRAGQVRNIGKVEGNKPVSDNDWEAVKKGGDEAIKRWINGQMEGRSVAIVLIGQNTAGRKWIKYEIEKAWNDKKGVVGIYIHNLKNEEGEQASKGSNPFTDVTLSDGKSLSSYAKTYDPPYSDSTKVYEYISSHIEDWADEAYKIRNPT